MINEAVFIDAGDFSGLWGTVEDERGESVLVRVTEDLAVWVPSSGVTLWDDSNQSEGWDVERYYED